jgi:hypothetical protein
VSRAIAIQPRAGCEDLGTSLKNPGKYAETHVALTPFFDPLIVVSTNICSAIAAPRHFRVAENLRTNFNCSTVTY